MISPSYWVCQGHESCSRAVAVEFSEPTAGGTQADYVEWMLEIEDVWAAGDRGNVAVKGVSLEVRAGEVVTIIGANGAGKSTTMKTVSGVAELAKSVKGSIAFAGSPPASVGFVSARGGMDVVLIDRDQASADKGLGHCVAAIDGLIAKPQAVAIRQFRMMVARAQTAVPTAPAMLAQIAGQARNLLGR